MWIGVFKGSEVSNKKVNTWLRSKALHLNVMTSPAQFQDMLWKWTHLVMDSDADTKHFCDCTGLQSPTDLPVGGNARAYHRPATTLSMPMP